MAHNLGMRWLVFSLFVCLFVGALHGQGTTVVDKIVAKVEKNIVLLSEVKDEHRSLLASGMSVEECEVLESLIVNRMLLVQAAIDSVGVSQDEVENELNRRFDLLLGQFGSQQVLEDLYEKSVYQLKDELREEVKHGMTTQRMVQHLSQEVRVTPQEVRAFYDPLPTEEIPYLSTQVSIAQIVRVPEPSQEREEEVAAQLKDIRSELLQGKESFEVLARRHSMDPSVAQNGGTLGFFSLGQLAPEYEAAALRLAPGAISMPVRTSFGYHLIELLGKRGKKYNSRHLLWQVTPSEEDMERAEKSLKRLRERVIAESLSFEKMAMEHSEDEATRYNGGYLTGAGNSRYLSVEALDPLLFFTLDTLAMGAITQPMRYKKEGKEAWRIIFYKDKIQAHKANLAQDYGRFEEACLREKKEKYMKAWSTEAKENMFIEVDDLYESCGVLR